MTHRDDLTDEQLASEVGVPVALVTWARTQARNADADMAPPPVDPAYDVDLQRAVIANTQRLYSHYGLLDGTRPIPGRGRATT